MTQVLNQNNQKKTFNSNLQKICRSGNAEVDVTIEPFLESFKKQSSNKFIDVYENGQRDVKDFNTFMINSYFNFNPGSEKVISTTLLMECMYNNMTRAVKFLLKDDTIDVLKEHNFGHSAIHFGVINNSYESTKVLLEYGTKKGLDLANRITSTDNFINSEKNISISKDSPLICALVSNVYKNSHSNESFYRIKMIKLLLSHGADISKKICSYQNTCLYAAIARGRVESLKYLLENIVQNKKNIGLIYETNTSGHTLLHLAVGENSGYNKEILELLLPYYSKTESIDKKTLSGNSVFHCATGEGYLEIMIMLLKKYPNLDILTKNKWNHTPFISSVICNNLKIVNFFMTYLFNETFFLKKNIKIKNFLIEPEKRKDVFSHLKLENLLNIIHISVSLRNIDIINYFVSISQEIPQKYNDHKLLKDNKFFEEFSKFLAFQANVLLNEENPCDGYTPLMYAIISGCMNSIELLLMCPNVLFSYESSNGLTAISLAERLVSGKKIPKICSCFKHIDGKILSKHENKFNYDLEEDTYINILAKLRKFNKTQKAKNKRKKKKQRESKKEMDRMFSEMDDLEEEINELYL